jgi:hypothetical protein
MSRILPVGCLVVFLCLSVSVGSAEEKSSPDPSPLELFDQRILPIFNSPKPSSCVQCHLAAVDLKNYIFPSQEKTFASLRDQGLIDLDQPEKSKILTLIKMGEKDLDKGAKLIHKKTRNAEYKAFAAWIKATSRDPKMRNLPQLAATELARPEKPDAVIRHMRKSRVVDSFVRNAWSQRMRCFPCHTPHEIDPSNRRHKAAVKSQREFKLKYSEEILSRLPIFKKTPEETLQYLIEKSRTPRKGEPPLINLQNPSQSLLVLKPTSKLPPKNAAGKIELPNSSETLYHMGGLKMHPDDQSYKSFISWIQDYANVVGNRYAAVEDLPADNWHASQLVLKLSSTPEDWPLGVPVQLFLHAWNEQAAAWEADPLAFTQGTVTPRKMAMGSLFMLAPRNEAGQSRKWDTEHAKLDPGRYLVKVYVDSQRQLSKNPTLLLGQEDFAGQTEIQTARWREGFRYGKMISADDLQRE